MEMAGEPLRDAGRLMFIDVESGFHISMTRLRARAPRGKRAAYGKVSRQLRRGKNQTLIASMTLQGGMGEAVSIKGATDAELSFETYDVEEFLAPTLEAGRVVVVVVLDGLWGRTGPARLGDSSKSVKRS